MNDTARIIIVALSSAFAGLLVSFIAVVKQKKQIEAELKAKDLKNSALRNELSEYIFKFREVQKTVDSTPSDCKLGGYCKSCEFSRTYNLYNYFEGKYEHVILCDKDGSCNNFVERKIEK